MLIIEKKAGGGIRGEGIFDFGKILLKKVFNSGLVKQATKAINSDVGQAAIAGLKKAAQSDLGQALKERAISEVKKKALDLVDQVNLPESVKEAAQSRVGQELQKNLISQLGKRSRPAADIATEAFAKLGVPPPTKRARRKRGRRKGRGYPTKILEQFGSGIVLE